jgi:hypothetical protein
VLRVVTDESTARRLVLRAAPWGPLDVLRRGLVTVSAAAMLPAAVTYAAHFGLLHLIWALPIAALLARLILRVPLVETAELGVDGSSRTLWVCRRGEGVWRSSRMVVALDDPLALVFVRSGLVAPEGLHRPELGLELYMGKYGERPRALAPRFAVEGVDRRDDVRLLVEALARCLGLRVKLHSNDLHEQHLLISHQGDAPPPLAGAGSGDQPALDVTRGPSFEAPAVPPAPLPLAGAGGELRERLSRMGDTLDVDRPTYGRLVIKLALWIGGLGLLGLAFATTTDSDAVYLFAVLATIPALSVLSGLFAMLIAGAVAQAFALLYSVVFGIRRTHPGGVLALEPHRWTLHGGMLEARLRARRRHFIRGRVGAVVLAPVTSRGKSGSWAWRELWLLAGTRWVLLARSNAMTGDWPGPTPVLESLAVEVARALDAPLRTAGAPAWHDPPTGQ